MKRSKRRSAEQPRCVLDSGGVTALIGKSQRARAWLRWLVLHGGELVIPTPILVECTTGDSGRDAEVNRVLGVLATDRKVLRPPSEATARHAGALRFSAKTDDGIDALVAAEAAAERRPSVVLTSDARDLTKLLANTHVVVLRV